MSAPTPAQGAPTALVSQFGLLGLGSATAGNLFHAITDDEAEAIFAHAWQAGIRHFDTSPHYGQGLAERRLGAFLQRQPRNSYYLSTKVGRRLVPNPDFHGELDPTHFEVPNLMLREVDYREAAVRLGIEESLQRLGLSRVDAAYVHDPEQHGAANTETHLRNGVAAVCALRDEGLIRLAGIGTGSVAAALQACELGDIDVVMLAGRWTLLDHSADELLETCQARGVAVIIAGPYQSGVLATDPPQPDAHYDYGAVPAKIWQQAQALAHACRELGTDLPTAAIQFPLRHKAVTALMLGAASREQLVQNLDRLSHPLPEDVWKGLQAQGIL